MEQSYIDIIGYIGTVVVVLAFTMSDINKLRIINVIACSIFIVYGYLSHTTPTVIVNTLIISLNLFQLIKYKLGNKK